MAQTIAKAFGRLQGLVFHRNSYQQQANTNTLAYIKAHNVKT